MRRVLRIVLLGLVLILVAMVSALMTMNFVIHGREVRLPNLAGLPVEQAANLLATQGLLLENQDKFYNESVPAGDVVSQSPAAGTRVRRGWQVQVAVSLGPPKATVPDVVGQSARAGEINVQRRGLELGNVGVIQLPNLPPDQVIAESPPANSSAISPKVDLLVTAPQDEQAFVMPDYTGRTVAQAARAIAAAGMKLGNFSAYPAGGWQESGAAPQPQIPAEVLNAHVTSQTPAAGSKVISGAVITLQWQQ